MHALAVGAAGLDSLRELRLVRLEALHRSFEDLRKDPGTGMSSWLRDHGDYHLAILMDPNGPFKDCLTKSGHDSNRDRFIPADPPPPDFSPTTTK